MCVCEQRSKVGYIFIVQVLKGREPSGNAERV